MTPFLPPAKVTVTLVGVFLCSQKSKKSGLKKVGGQGELSDYKPWIKVSDISSSGRSYRVFGHKTRRTHHLMSDLELATFLFLEWSPEVVDIREQFPLKFDDTLRIAQDILVKHPAVGVTFIS